MSKANERQVGGAHYGDEKGAVQHWDIVWQHKLDYFQGQITKYVMRWKKKNGLQDLEKARHFLDKYIELQQEAKAASPGIRTSPLEPPLYNSAAIVPGPVCPTPEEDPGYVDPGPGYLNPGKERHIREP